MIEILQRSHDDILGIRATGTLTDSDYEQVLVPKLKEIINRYGKAKFLFILDKDFEGWNSGGLWDYGSFGVRHKDDFSKVAAIGAPTWLDLWMKMKDFITAGEIRTFASEDEELAWTWIKS